MKYCKMQETEIQQFYGRRTRIADDGKELLVSRGGKNRGENGMPNALFHLNFVGVLLNKESQPVDITKGLKITQLIRCFYKGFSEEAVLVPLDKIANDSHYHGRKSLYVTLTPNKVSYVMIAQPRNHDQGPEIKELSDLAEYASTGELVEGEQYCWDYFVFGIGVDYNLVADTDERLLSDAKFAGCTQRQERVSLLRNYLEENFGTTKKLIAAGQPEAKTAEAPLEDESSEEAPQKADDKTYEYWHFKDEIQHQFACAIDKEGRLLEPDKTEQHIDRHLYNGAEISVDEIWEDLPEDCVVIYYKRCCLSEAPEFGFGREPQELTLAQLERIMYLEQKMANELRAILGKYGLLQYWILQQQKAKWSDQIRKRAES